MILYLINGFTGYAATSLADAQLLIAALDDPGSESNAYAISRITGKIDRLVQGDTAEPLTISSIDDAAGTISSWVTDAGTTLAIGLGDPDPNGGTLYASTLSSTITGNTRRATLALNTTALAAACNRGRMQQPAPFCLQLITTTAGVTETRGLIPLQVAAPVFPGSTLQDLTPTGYVTTPAARAGYVINLAAVTSLTGGGATTLDGQAAGTATYPVGCIVMTSDGNVGRSWRLLGTNIAATDLALGRIKPTNSDAVLNPCHWQLI